MKRFTLILCTGIIVLFTYMYLITIGFELNTILNSIVCKIKGSTSQLYTDCYFPEYTGGVLIMLLILIIGVSACITLLLKEFKSSEQEPLPPLNKTKTTVIHETTEPKIAKTETNE